MDFTALITAMRNYFSELKSRLDTHVHDDRYYTKSQGDDRYAPDVHDHNTLYYTKAQVDSIADSATGETNLSIGGSGNTRSINSSTGTNANVPLASTTTAGFMSTGDKTKLNNVEAGAEKNIATNLGLGGTGNNRTITSSTGANVTLPVVSSTTAGLMRMGDLSKLDGIEAGAQKNIGDVFDNTGNYAGLRARATTKADVGLPNVNDIALNWSYGTEPITHIWGSSGDATESYVYKASDLATFLDLGTAASRGITSTRTTSSTDLLLTAKGMDDHLTSGDHDNQYYNKTIADDRFAPVSHNHDTRYYTKTEVDNITGSFEGATNLSMGGSGNSRSINSSTGSDVSVPVATTTNAGFMSTGDKTKLNGVEAGAEKNVDTNLSFGGDGSNLTINSSTGSSATVPIVTTNDAGFMAPTDKIKLDNIESSADKNLAMASTAEAEAATINTKTMSPLRTKEAFEKFIENGFVMPRTKQAATIDFGTRDTDRGYIEHVTSANGDGTGNALFKFHISDDAELDTGGNDRYEFGATQESTFIWWLMVNRYGINSRGDVTAFSDARNKKNFRSWDDPLAMLKQMQGGVYERTDMDQTQVGVLAQDMAKVLPEVVRYDDEDDQYSVAYGNLTAFLIESCKSLLERVEELERKQGGE